MAARRTVDSDNPFRVNSPRAVLSRARERFQLISEWWKMRREESRRIRSAARRDDDTRH